MSPQEYKNRSSHDCSLVIRKSLKEVQCIINVRVCAEILAPFPLLVTKLAIRDGQFYFRRGRGNWANTKKNPCTAFVEELKIVHSDTKQRNVLQTSEIKFIQSLWSRKKLPPPP